MHALTVPTINSNDSDALLQTWLKEDGEEVCTGETVAVLETTKASFDVVAEQGGLLHTAAIAGKRYDYGAGLGWIFTDAAEREQFFIARRPEREAGGRAGFAVTQAAQDLATRHGIGEERLRALGKKVIKSTDVEALVGNAAAAEEHASTVARPGHMLSAQQQTIARVVSRSHAAIPDSFLLKKVAVDAALDALGHFSREQKALASLPDLLVWAVARLPDEFPFCYGALRDDLRFEPSAEGNIGVTFDVGQGLYIPVVKSAATLPLKEIAKRMMAFRMRAARNAFHADDLTGGDISISINADADILCVIPVILPPQTCMLSLSAVLSEVTLDAESKPLTRRYVQLGIAFDHRAFNGFQANAFLNAIKARVEAPKPGDWL